MYILDVKYFTFFLFSAICSRTLGLPISDCETLDLAHDLDENVPKVAVHDAPSLVHLHQGPLQGAPHVEWRKFCSAEHIGTHMDAPLHFVKNGKPAHKITLDQVVGEACVFDISKKADVDSLAVLTVEDIQAWELANGAIPNGAIMLVHTGWSKHWSSPEKYLGVKNVSDEHAQLHFPGIHGDVAKWLLENRKIKAIGIDTLSIDSPADPNYPVHQLLLGAEIVAFENLNNLEHLPPRGATVFLLPIKLVNGSGSFVRAFAIGWNGAKDPCRIGNDSSSINIYLVLAVAILLIKIFFV